MGSARIEIEEDDNGSKGVLSRAIQDLFDGLSKKTNVRAVVKVSFLEIYNEELIDLLDFSMPNRGAKGSGEKPTITIREEKDKILLIGLKEEKVSSATEALQALERGTLRRSTSSTLMNETSSRSHSIFTITVEQRPGSQKSSQQEENSYNNSDPKKGLEKEDRTASLGYIESKFHLVDLAGSEKIKKQGPLDRR